MTTDTSPNQAPPANPPYDFFIETVKYICLRDLPNAESFYDNDLKLMWGISDDGMTLYSKYEILEEIDRHNDDGLYDEMVRAIEQLPNDIMIDL